MSRQKKPSKKPQTVDIAAALNAASMQLVCTRELFTRMSDEFDDRFDRFTKGTTLTAEPTARMQSIRTLYNRAESRTADGDLLVGDTLIKVMALDAQTVVFLNRDRAVRPPDEWPTLRSGDRHQWAAVLPGYCVRMAPSWIDLLMFQMLPTVDAFLTGSDEYRVDMIMDAHTNASLVSVSRYLMSVGPLLDLAHAVLSARGCGPNYWAHLLKSTLDQGDEQYLGVCRGQPTHRQNNQCPVSSVCRTSAQSSPRGRASTSASKCWAESATARAAHR